MAEPVGEGPGRITSYEREGLVFDVRDEGPVDGDPVVLLHGFPERSGCWEDVVPRLHAAGFRTLAPDQRGYSRGARPRRRRDYAVERLADDVAALVDLVGGRAHVVGHDWGSNVAWTLAQTHPEQVRTLTAVSVPHPQAYLSAVLGTKQGLKSWYILMFNVPGLVELLARKERGFFDRSLRGSGMTREGLARFRREMVDDGALRGGLMWYRALPFARPSTTRRPVEVPTTMVWSDGDGFIDRAGVDRCADHVRSDYELVVLQGVSHWIPTEAPEALAEAILERVLA